MKTKDKSNQKKIEIYEEALAGVAHSDYQRVAGIRAGRECKLFWERSNIHDPNAIKVTLDDVHIGYIKAKDTRILHVYREKGIKLYCEIVSYNRNNPTWSMIVVRCWAEEPLVEDVAL